MYIDLRKTLKKIADQLPENKTPEPAQLEKAYELTLRLRSQLIAVQYDMEQFGMAAVTPAVEPVDQFPQTEKKMIVLTIPEPLPARKELTSNVDLLDTFDADLDTVIRRAETYRKQYMNDIDVQAFIHTFDQIFPQEVARHNQEHS